MDIKSKLEILKKAARKVDEKYQLKKETPEKKAENPAGPPDFFTEETSVGTVYYREEIFSSGYRHGNVRLFESADTPAEIFSFITGDPHIGKLPIRRALFIDTETTGLAGGTGTMAFLTGVGFFREKDFIVRQYFVPDYSMEAPMLVHLQQLLKEFEGVITFNGKAFDWPLLLSRMIMNRIRPEKSEPLHLDLLFPARRLWKLRAGSCRLSCLENSILDYYRYGDIPGFLIPEIYFEYIRTKNFRQMEKVLEHNRSDVLSMAAIIVKMQEHLEMGRGLLLENAEDYHSLGRISEIQKEENLAVEYYEKALNCRTDEKGRMAVMKRLSLIYRRQGRWHQAEARWQEMAEIDPGDPWAMVELSKYYEHKAGDLYKAREYAILAENIFKSKARIRRDESAFQSLNQLGRRLKRIQGKIIKSGKNE